MFIRIMKARVLIMAVAMLAMPHLQAQDESAPADLPEQYRELKTKSNNYQIYKVVKEKSLDDLWKSAMDTLRVEREEIQALNKEVKQLKARVDELKAQVEDRDSQLEEQAYMIDHMSFMGSNLTKGAYITFTWILIFVLFFTALVLYLRFKSAHKVTAQTRKEMGTLQNDFEEHKKKTRENESKLRRDLQTEINKVEELKAQIEGDA